MDGLSDQPLNLRSLFMDTVTTPQCVSSSHGSGKGSGEQAFWLLCSARLTEGIPHAHRCMRSDAGVQSLLTAVALAQEPHM